MKRDIKLFLEDIIEQIELIENSVKRKAKLLKNKDIQDATVRRLEIIGEAAKNIPNSFREKYPKVEWKEIAGTRDIMSHAYFKVELDVGEDAKVDVTDDGFYDIYVKLNGINSSKANLLIQKIHEEVPAEVAEEGVGVETTGEIVGEEVPTPAEEVEKAGLTWLLVSIVILVVVIVVLVALKKKRK